VYKIVRTHNPYILKHHATCLLARENARVGHAGEVWYVIGKNRVVLTGIGVLAANGSGKDAFWTSLLAGETGIGPITLFDAAAFKSRIAGEVKHFEPEDYREGRIKARRLSRNVQFGIKTALMAVRDAGLTKADLRNTAPIPIVLGISLGGFDHIERQIKRVAEMGPDRLVPHAVEGCIHLMAASLIGAVLDVETELSTLSNSCVGGLDAIAQGAHLIRDGKAELCICGGTEAPIVESALAGFCAAGMVSTMNDHPGEASRPFDVRRDGGVLAEGSGIIVLESEEHARGRGATAYAEIMGYGTARDRVGGISGNGLEMSMRKALDNAGLLAADIDAVFAHGPSDPTLDASESKLIEAVFGEPAYLLPVTSIKGATGNPLAAGGSHQVIAAALALKEAKIPPTANLTQPDPDCALDYVQQEPRHVCSEHMLINAHGSGGMNSSLIIGGIG
jgi:3-oxoacyl-[acyl-carrier-protein] synthase II